MTGKRGGKGAFAPRPGYEVGYGKPPASGQFKKGQSGNPRGRPKGSKNKVPGLHEERMKSIILEEAYRGISVRDGERSINIPIVQAVMRSLAVNAVKGQHRSQRLFAELLTAAEASNRALYDAYLNAVGDYKISWERELDRRDRLGITDLPDPIPHPDHIDINIQTGEIRILGPMTLQQKEALDQVRKRKVAFEEELASLLEMSRNEDDPGILKLIKEDVEHTLKTLDTLNSILARIPKPGQTRFLEPNGWEGITR